MKLAPQRNLKISHTQEGLLPRSGRLLTSYFFRRGKFEEKKRKQKEGEMLKATGQYFI